MTTHLDQCHWGEASARKLDSVHPELQRLFNEVVRRLPSERDATIGWGHRGKAEQEDAFSRHASKARFPHSAHNSSPSRAVDCWPYPTDWKRDSEFWYLRGFVEGVALELGIKLRTVISWDPGHFELAKV